MSSTPIRFHLARSPDLAWLQSRTRSPLTLSPEDLTAIAWIDGMRVAHGRLRALNPDTLCLDDLQICPTATEHACVPELIAFLFRQAQPCFKAIYGLPSEYLLDKAPALPSTPLFRQGRFDLAAQQLEQTLKREANTASLLLLARCHHFIGNHEQTRAAIERALYGRIDSAHAWLALADWEAVHGNMASCVDGYRQAATASPLSIKAHVNLEYALRALGRFNEAAEETEWQLRRQPIDDEYYPHGWLLPRWHGQTLPKGHLLIHWVDGYGDMILNARYLPRVAQRVAKLTVECPLALLRLFRNAFPQIRFLPTHSQAPHGYDRYTSLIALAAYLDEEHGPVPRTPYLSIGTRERACPNPTGIPRIGINRQASHYSPSRSFPATCLPRFVEMKLGALTSLMPFRKEAEKRLLKRYGIADAGSGFTDFFDAAYRIQEQDLVISVDTALAHLAAAMGKTTVLLLNEPAAPMWRNRAAIHRLYPTMRILAKPIGQSWPSFLQSQTTLLHTFIDQLDTLPPLPSISTESLPT